MSEHLGPFLAACGRPCIDKPFSPGEVRAEQVRIFSATAPPTALDTVFDGTVRERIFEGDRIVYEIACPALDAAAVYAFDHDPIHHKVFNPEEAVRIGWNAADLMIFS